MKPSPGPPGSRPRNAQAVRGKTFILGLLGALFLVVGVVFWIGVSGGSKHVPLGKAGVGFTADPAQDGQAAAAPSPASSLPDGGPLTTTIIDRQVRDELRRRILAAWAAEAEPEVAAAAKQGRFLPAPAGAEGGAIDPKYIREVVRQDFIPMASRCYEELLSRKDAGGRVNMRFTIVADDKLGGVVEDVGVDSDGGLDDERMTTCMRESMSTLAFRPPSQGRYVTVVYPLELSPGDAGPDEPKP